jgi:hypothetical protein
MRFCRALRKARRRVLTHSIGAGFFRRRRCIAGQSRVLTNQAAGFGAARRAPRAAAESRPSPRPSRHE